MKHHEDNEQIAFMAWCKYVMIDLDCEGVSLFELFIHIRNESYEKGTKIQRAIRIKRAKSAGFKSGTPDLFLPLPLHGKPGLFIEMKRKNVKGETRGRVSKNQLKRLELHEKCGYVVAVCEGWEEAKFITENYIKGK